MKSSSYIGKTIKVEICPHPQGREITVIFNDEKIRQRFSELEENKE